MSSEAYDLLNCFVSGLDDIIYEIAEGIASAKNKRTSAGTVQIDKDDVRAAAQIVFEAIRDQAGKAIPQVVAEQIEQMHQCVLSKCRENG